MKRQVNERRLNGRRQKPLIDGTRMCCPRCKEWEDVLAYTPLGIIDEFIGETCQIYKCPRCRWLFAPAPSINELFREDVSRV